jgi:hypothetical protein
MFYPTISNNISSLFGLGWYKSWMRLTMSTGREQIKEVSWSGVNAFRSAENKERRGFGPKIGWIQGKLGDEWEQWSLRDMIRMFDPVVLHVAELLFICSWIWINTWD